MRIRGIADSLPLSQLDACTQMLLGQVQLNLFGAPLEY